MLLGTTFNSGVTETALREWLSFDHGASWTYVGVVQSGGGGGDGVYEPFVTLDSSGHLAMLFSDERQHATYSQFIGEVISTDGGLTWSATLQRLHQLRARRDQGHRQPCRPTGPACPPSRQLGNGGSYVMSYEMCGPHNCAVYTKTSADGDNWPARRTSAPRPRPPTALSCRKAR